MVDAVLFLDLGAAHEPADWFTEEQVAADFFGQAIAAEDFGAGGRGEVVERLVGGPKTIGAALHVCASHQRPHFLETRRKFALRAKSAVNDRHLKTQGSAFAARVHEKEFAVVVLTEAPLPAIIARGFFHDATRRPAQAKVVVRRVDAVVDRPEEATGLVLEIAAARTALPPELLFVRHAVAVAVSVNVEVECVGFANDDAPVIERQNHSWQQKFVGEDRVFIENAVALRRPVQRDAADGCELILAIDVLHVRAHLRDEHAPISIERADDRLLDVWLAEDEFEAVARRQLHRLQALRRGQRLLRWHRRKVVGGRGVKLQRECAREREGQKFVHGVQKSEMASWVRSQGGAGRNVSDNNRSMIFPLVPNGARYGEVGWVSFREQSLAIG